jgi:hypothetical protein
MGYKNIDDRASSPPQRVASRDGQFFGERRRAGTLSALDAEIPRADPDPVPSENALRHSRDVPFRPEIPPIRWTLTNYPDRIKRCPKQASWILLFLAIEQSVAWSSPAHVRISSSPLARLGLTMPRFPSTYSRIVVPAKPFCPWVHPVDYLPDRNCAFEFKYPLRILGALY